MVSRLAELELVNGGARIDLHSAHRVADLRSVFTTSAVIVVVTVAGASAFLDAVIVMRSTRHDPLVHLDMVSGSRRPVFGWNVRCPTHCGPYLPPALDPLGT